MIVADTMVWADFISHGDDRLLDLVEREATLMHPYVRGELSLGNLANRVVVLTDLDKLPAAPVARHDEVLGLIENARLFGTSVGFVDVHLLASTLLVADGRLWTRDRRLHAAAEQLGIVAAHT